MWRASNREIIMHVLSCAMACVRIAEVWQTSSDYLLRRLAARLYFHGEQTLAFHGGVGYGNRGH